MSASIAPPSRSHPRRFSSRYYGLIRLREALERVIASYAAGESVGETTRTVVDLGCGAMPYRHLFEPHVNRYVGVDIPGNDRADMVLDPHSGRVDLPDGIADFVLSTQVLEHVESPGAYLQEAHRLCKPTGRLFLSTHGLFKYHPEPGDFWRWTAEGLRRLLEQNGWQTERTDGVLGFAAASFAMLQDAVVLKLPQCRPLRRVVAGCMQQVVGLLDRTYCDEARRENAAVYLVVARPCESIAPR